MNVNNMGTAAAMPLDQLIKQQLDLIKKYHSLPKRDPRNPPAAIFFATDPGHQDVFLKDSGLKLYVALVDRVCQYPTPHGGKVVEDVHGVASVRTAFDDLIRRVSPDIAGLVQTLLAKNFPTWTIYIAVNGIKLNRKISTALVNIVPVGLRWLKDKRWKQRLKKHFPEIIGHPLVEVTDIQAPTEAAAFILAEEKAAVALSLISLQHPSLVMRRSVELRTEAFSRNHTDKSWNAFWTMQNRGITMLSQNRFDQKGIKDFKNSARITSKALTYGSPLSRVIEQGALLLQSAKVNPGRAVKLLLLVSSLDALLMEKFYPRQHGARFKVRAVTLAMAHMKYPRRAAEFVKDVYGLRSEIAHHGIQHRLRDEQYLILEYMCTSAIILLSKQGNLSHADALNVLGLLL